VWWVVAGGDKRDAVSRWKNEAALPVSAIRGKQQTLAWLDQAAWPREEQSGVLTRRESDL
jgi:hypothetical protein